MEFIQSRELGKLFLEGEVIFRQGDPTGNFYIVQKGRVCLTRESSTGEIMRAFLGDGEIFGIASAFTVNRERFATATALVDSVVLTIDEKVFISRLHQDPSIAFRLIRHLSQRLFDLGRDLASIDNNGKKPRKINKKTKISQWPPPIPERKLLNVHDFSAGYHFLIVEDEMDYFMIIKGWLANSVESNTDLIRLPIYKLTHATTFQEAERLLAQDKYDLILLDLNLPDSHGYNKTLVRMQDKAFDTPIIVFTGMDDDTQAIQAVEDGAQDYLVKGQVNRKILVRAIQHALSRHKMHKAALEELESYEDERGHHSSGLLRDWLNRCLTREHG